MGVRILADPQAFSDGACMYCSTTGVAFGPMFDDRDELVAFLEWWDLQGDLKIDPRKFTTPELVDIAVRFRDATGRSE